MVAEGGGVAADNDGNTEMKLDVPRNIRISQEERRIECARCGKHRVVMMVDEKFFQLIVEQFIDEHSDCVWEPNSSAAQMKGDG